MQRYRTARSTGLVGASFLLASALVPAVAQSSADLGGVDLSQGPFERIASFPVFLNSDITQETVSEIVAYAERFQQLIYTDAALGKLGFIDIADPADPKPLGTLDLGGDPTSVAVRRGFALACINTSVDFVQTSGELLVIDIQTRSLVRSIALGGQPDSISISPDGRYAAVVIENERDEDLGSGAPPQLPAGFLRIVDLVGPPDAWTTRDVSLTGFAALFPEDPEPEFVDISEANLAVVTLQENNHIAIVDLPTGQVVQHFAAGSVDLTAIDVSENDLIEQTGALNAVRREPDGVVWTGPLTFATANEGDLVGGSRGFTLFNVFGIPVYDAGNSLEHLVARMGHYPDDRSQNKGNEPEAVEFGRFGEKDYLFVGSERSNVVAVYELVGNTPTIVQVLATGQGPEGLLAIPSRDLLVVASENDAREDKLRAQVSIFKRTGTPNYPTLISANRRNEEVPIPWAAQSGLVPNPSKPNEVFSVHDSYYKKSRIYTLNVGQVPAVIERERALLDSNGVLLAALQGLKQTLSSALSFNPAAFVNADKTVNLDLEGIAVGGDGSFWMVSEGGGNLTNGVSNPVASPFLSPNLLVKVGPNGTILEAILPPAAVTAQQFRFGYEGVAVVGDQVYVCFQRRWTGLGDPADRVRIGRYDTVTKAWTYAYYALQTPLSANGGWVGLSELSYAGDGEFLVIERDDQGGPDAAVKHIKRFSINGVTFRDHSETPNFDTVTKSLVVDLLFSGVLKVTGGLVPEKFEGLAVLPNKDLLLINDNDGVEDNSGETQLLRLKGLLR